uniref:Lipid-binding serum glycoprotein C-terminal domain-containing protein n=1 Tax=Plectus sambesii TaxID=2011161 RepID=A0A914WCV4_9BILA
MIVVLMCKFRYQGHENDAGIPQASGTIAPAQNSQDLCLNFDADEIFGSAAYALQVSPLSHLTIDQNVLGTFGSAIQHFMQCHCSDNLCIGAIIPAIGAACPEGGVVDVSAQATDVVTFNFNSTGAFGDLKATAGFQSHFPNGEMHDLFHITTTVDLEVPSNLRFEGWMIKGQVLVTGADLQLGSSLIGNIDSAAIQQIWDTVLKIVVETSISHLLEAGIPLPQLPYVNVVNPNIWFAPHALTFCTDAQYTG